MDLQISGSLENQISYFQIHLEFHSKPFSHEDLRILTAETFLNLETATENATSYLRQSVVLVH